MGRRRERRVCLLAIACCCGLPIACSDGDGGSADGTTAPADGATAPVDGTIAPVDGTIVPADGATVPADGAMGPADAPAPSQDGGDGGGPQDTGPADLTPADLTPADLAPDTKCVPQSFTLAIVTPSGGSKCSFAFSKPFTPGEINLLLTPGWGTVCHAGSSSNCGSGASADGWWFSGGEIYLCDATCARFYKQTTAGKLTVRLGCPTEDCQH